MTTLKPVHRVSIDIPKAAEAAYELVPDTERPRQPIGRRKPSQAAQDGSTAPQAPPWAWSWQEVEAALIKATDTLRRLPMDVYPKGFKGSPKTIDVIRELQKDYVEVTVRLAPPEPGAIDRMDPVLAWLQFLSGSHPNSRHKCSDRKLVGLACMLREGGARNRVQWSRLQRMTGYYGESRRTLQRRYKKGLRAIAFKLTARGVEKTF